MEVVVVVVSLLTKHRLGSPFLTQTSCDKKIFSTCMYLIATASSYVA